MKTQTLQKTVKFEVAIDCKMPTLNEPAHEIMVLIT